MVIDSPVSEDDYAILSDLLEKNSFAISRRLERTYHLVSEGGKLDRAHSVLQRIITTKKPQLTQEEYNVFIAALVVIGVKFSLPQGYGKAFISWPPSWTSGWFYYEKDEGLQSREYRFIWASWYPIDQGCAAVCY